LSAGRQPFVTQATSSTDSRQWTKPRFIQHKNEAKWFYRYLSIVYDTIVNPPHWNEDMRTDALEPAKLDKADLEVVDVGGGTGFCTQGIVKHVRPQNVTLIDQSPDQLNKARQKADLQGVTIVEGDAEDLPFATDSFDRYISAGSIEYWPEPQRGIREAYRVVKEGGLACMIGPVHPTFFISRFFADMWMLFPTEQEYIDWYTKAGFTDVKIKRIGPKFYRGVRAHGLIMGCSVTGTKPKAGDSPLQMGPKREDSVDSNTNPLSFLFNFIVGTLAGSYYFVLPIVMWLRHRILLLVGR
jgi:MPBQ/MSBQ methyltransferase